MQQPQVETTSEISNYFIQSRYQGRPCEKITLSHLPDTFALEFDGWTSGTCVVLIASYSKNGVHEEALLALAPLLNEDSLGAEQHIEFIESTLALYNKSLTNMV